LSLFVLLLLYFSFQRCLFIFAGIHNKMKLKSSIQINLYIANISYLISIWRRCSMPLTSSLIPSTCLEKSELENIFKFWAYVLFILSKANIDCIKAFTQDYKLQLVILKKYYFP
jgi:hypothetical protein